ncbi:MAG: hypothetical protein M1587_08325 [Thaumarchaeota archaeon]|nr:hypothetical protein [Nitrososphaerota archaeon]
MTGDKENSNIMEMVNVVMTERERITQVGKELLELLTQYEPAFFQWEEDQKVYAKDRLPIEKKILELSQHLSNIAGFCDSGAKRAIHIFTTGILDASMLTSLSYTQLKAVLPTIIGMQVDYARKPPFRLIGSDVKALGARIGAVAQR